MIRMYSWSVCVGYGWFSPAWVSLHTCCAWSNQCTQVKAAVLHAVRRDLPHGVMTNRFFAITLCSGDGRAHQRKPPRWHLATLTFRAHSRRFYPKRLAVRTRTDGGADHARRQPARQERLRLGVFVFGLLTSGTGDSS